MSKLKKIRTINLLRMSFYRDQTGKRFYRWRDSQIRKVPRWIPGKRSMRWVMVAALLVVIGSIAYPPVMRYASDKVVEKVADQLFTEEELENIVQDPGIQKIIQQLENSDIEIPENGAIQEAPSISDPVVVNAPIQGSDMVVEEMSFATNQEALKFLLKKFGVSELKSMTDKAEGGLTKEEKSEIKQFVMERLTQTEYDSLKIIAAMEIQRRQGNLIIEP